MYTHRLTMVLPNMVFDIDPEVLAGAVYAWTPAVHVDFAPHYDALGILTSAGHRSLCGRPQSPS